MSEIKRPATKRLPFSHSTAYFVTPNPVCSTARIIVDLHHSVEEDNLSRQEEPSAKGITTYQFSSKAINSWSKLLVASLSAAKWGRAGGRTEAKREREQTKKLIWSLGLQDKEQRLTSAVPSNLHSFPSQSAPWISQLWTHCPFKAHSRKTTTGRPLSWANNDLLHLLQATKNKSAERFTYLVKQCPPLN